MTRVTALLVVLSVAALAAGPSAVALKPADAHAQADALHRQATDARPARVESPRLDTDGPAFTELWNLPVTGFDDALYTVGVVPVDDVTKTEMWVSSGGIASGAAKITVYDLANPAHPQLAQFNQPIATASWGIRDMAYNEALDEVYGCGTGTNQLQIIDATTHALKSSPVMSTGPSTMRAIALDADDSLYTNNWYNPTYKCYRDASNAHVWQAAIPPTNVANYGAAYDAQGYFWYSAETFSGSYHLLRYDYPSMTNPDSFPVTGASVYGGGCEFWEGSKLLLLDQNDPDDIVRCLQIYVTDNVGVSDYWRPTPFGEFAGTEFQPECYVYNNGANNATDVDVTCLIEAGATTYYDETVQVDIDAGDDGWVQFPLGVTLDVEQDYTVTYTVYWADDDIPGDDELVYAGWPVNDTLEVAYEDMDPSAPDNGVAWYAGGDGVAVGIFNYWGGVDVIGTKVALYPTTWPVPGDDQYEVGIYDFDDVNGIPGTELYHSATLTGVRGGWHEHELATPVHIETDFLWTCYQQVGDYPNCAGIALAEPQTSPEYAQLELVAGDWYYPSNAGDYGIRFFITRATSSETHDVGATGVTQPAGSIVLGTEVWPVVTVENFGEAVETFNVEVLIEDGSDAVVFQQEEEVAALGIGESREVTFSTYSWMADPVGDYTVTVTTKLAGDDEPGNDAYGPDAFDVYERPPWPGGWVEVERVPAGTKEVKDGAWLTVDPATQMIYATKGNKTSEFYSYDATKDSWYSLADVPTGTEGKPPKKGCRGVADGAGSIYMTKGNNTFGFYRYDIGTNTWEQLADVPAGVSGKKVKGGTDLAYVQVSGDTGWVYTMKGYKTEFFRYNTATGVWETRANMPFGYKEKWDKGSWLAYDGGNYIYAQQAKYYNKTTEHHYMYRYDIDRDSFAEVTGMPVWGLHSGKLRKKKVKDGGAGAYYDEMIYALKGGNTQQFFGYDIAQDTWTELDTVPNYSPTTGRKRRVKNGGDLVSYGNGAFFALKGNKTYEFWRYVLPVPMGVQPERSGALAGRTGQVPAGLTVAPNPLSGGYATVRYSLPQAGAATVSVFDVTGRTVLSRNVTAARNGAVSLDVRSLSAGIYLVKLETEGWNSTAKLVVQH